MKSMIEDADRSLPLLLRVGLSLASSNHAVGWNGSLSLPGSHERPCVVFGILQKMIESRWFVDEEQKLIYYLIIFIGVSGGAEGQEGRRGRVD